MWTLIFIFGFFALTTFALYSPSDDVIILKDNNFKEQVLESDEIWIINFYAPWSGHCKSLAPRFKEAATLMKSLKGIVKFGVVDGTENPNIVESQNIHSYTTVKLFGTNKNGDPIDIRGRSVQDLIKVAERVVQEMFDQILKTEEKLFFFF